MDREFVPPGPGSWTLETTHLNCAMTAYAAQGWLTGLTRGFKEGIERYGLMLSHLELACLHGFMYARHAAIVSRE